MNADTLKTASDYLPAGKLHPCDERPKPTWSIGPDGRSVLISSDIRFDHLFAEWQADACAHDRTGIIEWVNGGNQTCFNWFCAHCGHKLSSNIPHALAREHGVVKSSQDEMHSRSRAYVAQREARLAQMQREAAERAQPENREEYDDYLRSARWRALRNRVLARAGGLCEACLDLPASQVHHLTYAHKGNEFAWELRAVCDDCHERLHVQEAAE